MQLHTLGMKAALIIYIAVSYIHAIYGSAVSRSVRAARPATRKAGADGPALAGCMLAAGCMET